LYHSAAGPLLCLPRYPFRPPHPPSARRLPFGLISSPPPDISPFFSSFSQTPIFHQLGHLAFAAVRGTSARDIERVPLILCAANSFSHRLPRIALSSPPLHRTALPYHASRTGLIEQTLFLDIINLPVRGRTQFDPARHRLLDPPERAFQAEAATSIVVFVRQVSDCHIIHRRGLLPLPLVQLDWTGPSRSVPF
jgi:hypothetical protein